MRNQLLPTLSRLVEPLEDVPRSYLCSCLGLEYQATTAEEYAMEDVDFACQFVPRVKRTDYGVLYAQADPIPIRCGACGKEFSFVGVLPMKREGSVGMSCAVSAREGGDELVRRAVFAGADS